MVSALQDDEKGFLGLHEADIGYHRENFDLTLSGIVDTEAYLIRDSAPGFILAARDPLWNGRGTFFLDAGFGKHLSFFAQARVDRGFDAHWEETLDMRLDEWFARYTTDGEGWSVSAQVGKFATPIGNFVPRHDSMHNPFVRAPMLYDHVTTISDDGAPTDNDDLINARDELIGNEQKETWAPVIWGPSYGTGAMVFATVGRLDLRLALTNATPCERPEEWNWRGGKLRDMAWAGRVGWNPFIGFKVGVNAAYGPYYRDIALDSLPQGKHKSDYPQRLLGVDLEYSIGHFLLYGEGYLSQWAAPNLGNDPRTFAYYIEAKYKLFPGFYVAGRWNQMLFSKLTTGAGDSATWNRDAYRVQIAAGYFIEVNLLVKAEYDFNVLRGPNDPRDNMASFSLSLSF